MADLFHELDDDGWLAMLNRSLDDPSVGLPGFPPAETQALFVGFSGADALRPAFHLYKMVAARLGGRLGSANILDFGAGWGRVIRMFLRETAPERLFSVDVDPEILEVCRQTGVPGTLTQVDPLGVLPFPDGYFGACYSFSVFSHLAEAHALRWLQELIRVTEPGGSIVFTTSDRRLLDVCVACFHKQVDRNPVEENYARFFPDPVAAKAAFLAGQHVFGPTGGHSPVLDKQAYGWACIPAPWVGAHFGDDVRMELFSMSEALGQTVICLTVKKGQATPSTAR